MQRISRAGWLSLHVLHDNKAMAVYMRSRPASRKLQALQRTATRGLSESERSSPESENTTRVTSSSLFLPVKNFSEKQASVKSHKVSYHADM